MSPNRGVLLGLLGRSEELLGHWAHRRQQERSWSCHVLAPGISRALVLARMKAGGGKPQTPAVGLICIYLRVTNTPVGKAK